MRLTRAALLCLLSALLFGLAAPLCKDLVGRLGELQLAGWLYLGAALAVLPFSLRGGSAVRRRNRRHAWILAGAIFFGGMVGPVLLLLALQRSAAGSVSLWLNFEVVATAGLGALFFREEVGRRTWVAVGCIAVAGVLLTAAQPGEHIVPALLVAAACVAWGLDNSFTALIDGLTPAQSTFAKGLVAGSANLGLGFILSEGGALSWLDVGKALAIGGACYGASIVLYIEGAQELGATRSQLIFGTAPFIGLVYAWTVLGEVALWSQALAALLMLAGLAVLLTAKHSHTHRHEALTHSHSHTHDDGHHAHRHEGLAPSTRHTHEHAHELVEHSHPHLPDLHHRHEH